MRLFCDSRYDIPHFLYMPTSNPPHPDSPPSFLPPSYITQCFRCTTHLVLPVPSGRGTGAGTTQSVPGTPPRPDQSIKLNSPFLSSLSHAGWRRLCVATTPTFPALSYWQEGGGESRDARPGSRCVTGATRGPWICAYIKDLWQTTPPFLMGDFCTFFRSLSRIPRAHV